MSMAEVRYWLISGLSGDRSDVLTLELAGGGRVLPVFSFEEEAAEFLRARGDHRGGLRINSTDVLELIVVLSYLEVQKVLLDPMHEVDDEMAAVLVGVGRERFAESLLGGPDSRSNRSGHTGALPVTFATTTRSRHSEGISSGAVWFRVESSSAEVADAAEGS